MDAARESEGFLYEIKAPRLEDAGLEDCALPPELIKEAFRKAASAINSTIENHEGGQCVDDPREDSADVLVAITEGVTAPSGGCVADKDGGLTEPMADKVNVTGGELEKKEDKLVVPEIPKYGEACVGGLQGLKIDENEKGVLGKILVDQKADVDGDGKDEDDDGPTLAEGFYV